MNVGRHKKSLCSVYREMKAISSISTVVPVSPVGCGDIASVAQCFAPGTYKILNL